MQILAPIPVILSKAGWSVQIIAGKSAFAVGYLKRDAAWCLPVLFLPATPLRTGFNDEVMRVATPDWFVMISDEIRGPFTADQMRDAVKKNLVQSHTQVRKGGSGDWFRADQVQGLLPPAQPSEPPQFEPEQPLSPEPSLVHDSAPIESIVSEQFAAGPSGKRRKSKSRPRAPVPPLPELDRPVIKSGAKTNSPVRRSKQRRRHRSSLWPVLTAAVAGFGLLLGLLYWLSLPSKPQPVPVNQPPAAASRR